MKKFLLAFALFAATSVFANEEVVTEQDSTTEETCLETAETKKKKTEINGEETALAAEEAEVSEQA